MTYRVTTMHCFIIQTTITLPDFTKNLFFLNHLANVSLHIIFIRGSQVSLLTKTIDTDYITIITLLLSFTGLRFTLG